MEWLVFQSPIVRIFLEVVNIIVFMVREVFLIRIVNKYYIPVDLSLGPTSEGSGNFTVLDTIG